MESINRISWDEFFMKQAVVFSERATCLRLKVGSVIVKDHILLGEGYNGSIKGHDHCIEVGCLKNKEGRCIRCIHSEVNAVLNACKKGVSVEGATIYVTHRCCENCTKILNQAGIARVVYLTEYANDYNHLFEKGMVVEEFKGRNREELEIEVKKINGK